MYFYCGCKKYLCKICVEKYHTEEEKNYLIPIEDKKINVMLMQMKQLIFIVQIVKKLFVKRIKAMKIMLPLIQVKC